MAAPLSQFVMAGLDLAIQQRRPRARRAFWTPGRARGDEGEIGAARHLVGGRHLGMDPGLRRGSEMCELGDGSAPTKIVVPMAGTRL